MKVFYRKAPGCFIYTDRYYRPRGYRFRNRSLKPGAFLLSLSLPVALALALSTLY